MNSEFPDSMDPSLLQVERELYSLTPAAPSRELVRSLQVRMEPAAPSSPQSLNKVHAFPWRRVVAPAAAAAAAVAVMSLENHRRTSAVAGKPGGGSQNEAAPAIKWEPMPMRSEYRALLDAGYVLNENMEPVQAYLMDTVDHHEWRNPANNSSVRLSLPGQHRFLAPAGYEGAQSQSWNGVPFH